MVGDCVEACKQQDLEVTAFSGVHSCTLHLAPCTLRLAPCSAGLILASEAIKLLSSAENMQ